MLSSSRPSPGRGAMYLLALGVLASVSLFLNRPQLALNFLPTPLVAPIEDAGTVDPEKVSSDTPGVVKPKAPPAEERKSTCSIKDMSVADVVVNDTIVGDVQCTLNWVVLGFAKCGTTTLGHWLAEHPEIMAFGKEMWLLLNNRPPKMVEYSVKHYNKASWNQTVPPKIGYKQPKDIYMKHVMDALRKYWPETKLIVSLRHPVTWFESYWNFRYWEYTYEPDMYHIGRTKVGPLSEIANLGQTLTGMGEFHVYMSLLGKTAQTAEELELIKPFLLEGEEDLFPFPKLPNQLFVLDTSQLSDANETRSLQLRQDLTDFLELGELLPPIRHIRPETLWQTEEELAKREANRITLCKPMHNMLRAELLRIGEYASQWLREYFIPADGVHASSIGYLEEILDTWKVDPCNMTASERRRYHI